MSRTNFVVLFTALLLVSLTSKRLFGAVNLNSETPSFAIPAPEYSIEDSKPLDSENTPEVHSQDGLPICCSEAARTLYLQNLAKLRKASCTQHGTNCEPIKDDQIPSVLSMAAIANEGVGAQVKPNNPLSLDFLPGLEYVMKQVSGSHLTYAESCFSFDQFVSRYNGGSPTQEAKRTRDIFLKLKTNFDSAKKLEAAYVCLECLNKELHDDFNLSIDVNQIADALREQSFDRFLHLLLVGGCKKGVKFSLSAYSMWPKEKTREQIAPKDTLSKIKDILTSKNAVGMTICPYDIPIGNLEACSGGSHCIVVTGYKKMCTPTKTSCKDLVHVQNSWGADWQQQNNDGWVDADTLLKHADVGRSSQLFSFDP